MQRGASYEYGQLVEERLNKHLKTGPNNKIFVAFVPLPRAMLLPALIDGKIDLVAAQVTVTEVRGPAFSDHYEGESAAVVRALRACSQGLRPLRAR